ncbi:MAG: hypothetical protein M1829_003001 [Trizodia sp. TS-e1964]|nr:MAG: hypothetical protein M1829_003001 [Trizodia sp. TS-e1964]
MSQLWQWGTDLFKAKQAKRRRLEGLESPSPPPSHSRGEIVDSRFASGQQSNLASRPNKRKRAIVKSETPEAVIKEEDGTIDDQLSGKKDDTEHCSEAEEDVKGRDYKRAKEEAEEAQAPEDQEVSGEDEGSEGEAPDAEEEGESGEEYPKATEGEVSEEEVSAEEDSEAEIDDDENVNFDDDEELDSEAEDLRKQKPDLSDEIYESTRQELEQEIKKGKWSPAVQELLIRLAMRSVESILPEAWVMDFPSFPEDLFVFHKIEAYLQPAGLLVVPGAAKTGGVDNFLSTRAMRKFIETVTRARGVSPEKWLRKGIEDFLKWAAKDGGYYRKIYLPVIIVSARTPNQSVEKAENSLDKKLKSLAAKHRAALRVKPDKDVVAGIEGENLDPDLDLTFRRRPPTLFGLLIENQNVTIISLDSSKGPEMPARLVAQFDFVDSFYDTWNCLAIAILSKICSHYVTWHLKEYEDKPEDSDPDF